MSFNKKTEENIESHGSIALCSCSDPSSNLEAKRYIESNTSIGYEDKVKEEEDKRHKFLDKLHDIRNKKDNSLILQLNKDNSHSYKDEGNY